MFMQLNLIREKGNTKFILSDKDISLRGKKDISLCNSTSNVFERELIKLLKR